MPHGHNALHVNGEGWPQTARQRDSGSYAGPRSCSDLTGFLKLPCAFLQIYTDWANHYLAKSGHRRLIKDLQQDVTDGVLLAQIIQVVGKSRSDLKGMGLRGVGWMSYRGDQSNRGRVWQVGMEP